MGFARSVIILGALLGALAFASCGRGSSKPTPTATSAASPTATAAVDATATPTATPTPPEVINGVTVTPLTAGAPVDLPKGVVLYVEGGCQSCDQPAVSLDRIWRDLYGTVHSDRLFERANPNGNAAEYITSIAVGNNGANMLIGVCSVAYCGGVGQIQAEAKVTFFASVDGGISWQDVGSVEGGGWAMTASFPAAGGIVRHVYRPSAGADWKTEYMTMPGNQVITSGPPLAGDATVLSLGYEVVFRGDDQTSLWPVAGSSAPLLAPKLPATASVIDAIQLDGPGARWALRWVQGAGPSSRGYLGLMTEREQTPARIFGYVPGDTMPAVVWLGGSVTLDGASSQSLAVNVLLPASALGSPAATRVRSVAPAILDTDTGQLHAIRELVARALTGGEKGLPDRTKILGVGRGTFVAVKGAGDCLNVRYAPSKSAQVAGCFKDGVLLNHLGQSTQADGVTWANVMTPSGAAGWASLEFLDLGAAGVTVSATQPAGVRSGDAGVDAVLDALASGDPARVIGLIKWTPIGCLAQPMGIGSPPKCPDGVAEGTLLDSLQGACAEGFYILRESLTGNPEFNLFRPQPLYAVWRDTGNLAWISHDAVALYGTPGGFATEVFIDGGKIAGFSACLLNPARILSEVPAANFLIMPR
ncbi:MAG: hypothetical protein HYX53_01775 [Chloroflexi bacterium]|nr:hypothetical protein [Chloroflexota bacterium]